MHLSTSHISYKRHRFSLEIIAHAVWLYARFNLSPRGNDFSYETVRRWTTKFGSDIARNLHRRQAQPGDIWHFDEVRVQIAGRALWLWRAVDQEGIVLDEILQSRRDKRAAKRLLKKLIKRHGLPKRIVTDKLRSYGAAKRELASSFEHWSHKGLNNRAENSCLPFRKRERCMQGVRSPGGLRRYVSCHSAVRNRFSVLARRRSANQIRYHRMEAFGASKSSAGIA